MAGVAGILSSDLKGEITALKIDPLKIKFLTTFELKLQNLGFRRPEEKACILLTTISREAAIMYHAASDIFTAGSAYEKAVKKLKALFMVPDP